MHAPDVFFAFRIDVIVQDALAIAVDVEIDGAGGNDAGKGCTEAPEKGAEAFVCVNAAEDLEGLFQVDVACAGNREEGAFLRERVGCVEFSELRLVEVGL